MSTPTDSTWADAFAAMSSEIQLHPAFPRLVREVAAQEGLGTGRLSWLARNSATFGSWITRGERSRRRGPASYRAVLLARTIADDLAIWPELPPGESLGRVYGEALTFVQRRLSGNGARP